MSLRSAAIDSNLHWLSGILYERRQDVYQIILASIFINILGIFYALFVMGLFNRVLPGGSLSSLVALGLGFMLILLFELVLRRIRGALIDHATATIDRQIGRELMRRMLRGSSMSVPRFTGERAMLFRDYEILRELVSSATITVLADMPFVILYLAAILLLGGWLVLVPVFVGLMLGAAAAFAILSIRSLDDAQQLAGQSRQATLIEALSTIETAKATGGALLLARRWESALDQQTALVFRQRQIANQAIATSTVGQSFAYATIMLVGAAMLAESSLTMGGLIAIGLLTSRTMAPFTQLIALLVRIRHGVTAWARLSGIFTGHPDGRGHGVGPSACSIEFRNVYFTWPGASSPALSNLSFSVAPGERVAIVGRVGAGKSSLFSLLLGLHRPQSGTILINGEPIEELDLDQLHEAIGYSPQDAALFSGTVAENLDPYTEEPDRTALVRALQIVGLDSQLLERALGERGEGLSGGERELLSLARALARPVSMLLLDEPSSGLDLKTEQDFVKRLAAVEMNSTILIVTHRPALLTLADRVIVLEGGAIVEDGPRDTILIPRRSARS